MEQLQQICENFDLTEVAARVLLNRGIDTSAEISRYLHGGFDDLYDPAAIPHIDEVAEVIKESAFFGDKITIYCDYDTDGITSAVVMFYAIKMLARKADVNIYISDRYKDGYGLSKRAVSDMDGTDLIITVDCGITDWEAIDFAQECGKRVVVIDHHESERTPSCPYVDLKVDQGFYPFREMCACGVAWKVAQYLNQKPLKNMIDIVAVATVTDVVDLVDENRIIVREGLDKIRHNNAHSGIQELLDIKGISNHDIKSHHIGFKIGPMLNATGRLETGIPAIKLLITSNEEERSRMAHQLNITNEERKRVEEEGFQAALEQVDPADSILICRNEDIAAGVVGLVAGRLRERFNKPTIVIGDGGKGSCRSENPLNMYELLCDCSDYLERFGGHAMAAGLSVADGLYEDFCEMARELTADIEYDDIPYDLEIPISDVSEALIYDLNRFAPFGKGNPRPRFKCEGVGVNNIRVLKDRHIKLQLEGGIDAIGFDMAYLRDECRNGSLLDIIYQPEINEWRGRKSVQLQLKKIS